MHKIFINKRVEVLSGKVLIDLFEYLASKGYDMSKFKGSFSGDEYQDWLRTYGGFNTLAAADSWIRQNGTAEEEYCILVVIKK